MKRWHKKRQYKYLTKCEWQSFWFYCRPYRSRKHYYYHIGWHKSCYLYFDRRHMLMLYCCRIYELTSWMNGTIFIIYRLYKFGLLFSQRFPTMRWHINLNGSLDVSFELVCYVVFWRTALDYAHSYFLYLHWCLFLETIDIPLHVILN